MKKEKNLEKPKKRGRPRRYSSEKITIDMLAYIANSDDPYVEEFALKEKISMDTIYRLAKEDVNLADTIKSLHLKQLLRTVRGAENGTINSTFAIFKLKQKQFGWTDKIEHTGEVNTNIKFTFK